MLSLPVASNVAFAFLHPPPFQVGTWDHPFLIAVGSRALPAVRFKADDRIYKMFGHKVPRVGCPEPTGPLDACEQGFQGTHLLG